MTSTHTSFGTVFRQLLAMTCSLLFAFALVACDGGNKQQQASASSAVVARAADQAADHADHAGATVDHADHAAATEDHSDHITHSAHPAPLAAGELPGESLYHLTGAFTAQDGAEFRLAELQGSPTVVVMFYGDCTTACPLLVKSAQDIEAALDPAVAQHTQFLMVSFDTARDTPDKLRAYADDKGLDKERWHWLIGSPLLTRQLATLLGVQFRDAGNGVFAHSNLVTVLDSAGVPTARIEGLGVSLDPALDAIRAAAH